MLLLEGRINRVRSASVPTLSRAPSLPQFHRGKGGKAMPSVRGSAIPPSHQKKARGRGTVRCGLGGRRKRDRKGEDCVTAGRRQSGWTQKAVPHMSFRNVRKSLWGTGGLIALLTWPVVRWPVLSELAVLLELQGLPVRQAVLEPRAAERAWLPADDRPAECLRFRHVHRALRPFPRGRRAWLACR